MYTVTETIQENNSFKNSPTALKFPQACIFNTVLKAT